MSGFQRPRWGIGRGRLQLPRIASGAPVTETVNNAFTVLETADAENVKRGQEISLPALLLTDADGATWRVTVSAAGALTTARVPAK